MSLTLTAVSVLYKVNQGAAHTAQVRRPRARSPPLQGLQLVFGRTTVLGYRNKSVGASPAAPTAPQHSPQPRLAPRHRRQRARRLHRTPRCPTLALPLRPAVGFLKPS